MCGHLGCGIEPCFEREPELEPGAENCGGCSELLLMLLLEAGLVCRPEMFVLAERDPSESRGSDLSAET
jgi:hypothetical protein